MKKEIIEKKYPIGTRIKLLYMEDEYGVPAGTEGTVDFIDDEGQIHMKWDNGQGLALVEGIDRFKVIKDLEREYEG